MRLEQVRRFHDAATLSLFGDLTCREEGLSMLTCERQWLNNVAGKSAVPEGFYHLVPHNGTKYRNTFALVGSTVSAGPSGLARFACVLHEASTGRALQGCIAWGERVTWNASGAMLGARGEGSKLVARLRALPGPHYLNITNAF